MQDLITLHLLFNEVQKYNSSFKLLHSNTALTKKELNAL